MWQIQISYNCQRLYKHDEESVIHAQPVPHGQDKDQERQGEFVLFPPTSHQWQENKRRSFRPTHHKVGELLAVKKTATIEADQSQPIIVRI